MRVSCAIFERNKTVSLSLRLPIRRFFGFEPDILVETGGVVVAAAFVVVVVDILLAVSVTWVVAAEIVYDRNGSYGPKAASSTQSHNASNMATNTAPCVPLSLTNCNNIRKNNCL